MNSSDECACARGSTEHRELQDRLERQTREFFEMEPGEPRLTQLQRIEATNQELLELHGHE